MRPEKELREAIAMLGASFVCGDLRSFVWGPAPEAAREAWAAFQAIGWVVGADDSGFSLTLEYVKLKVQQYADEEQEKKHAS